MASLYGQYLTEKTNDLIFETPEGFATYRYLNETTVYIVDIFVIPTERKGGAATFMADHIVKEAKARGCKEVIGSVVPSAKNSTTSLRVLLGYGMTLANAQNDFIVFKKEII